MARSPASLVSPLDATGLLNSFNPGSLLGGALDPNALTADLNGLLPGGGTELGSLLGTNFGADLANLLGTNVGADLSSLLPSAGSTIPDLALNLLTSLF